MEENNEWHKLAAKFQDQTRALMQDKEDLHNKIMVKWEKDFGSIHNEQTMDAYTVSGFIKSIK